MTVKNRAILLAISCTFLLLAASLATCEKIRTGTDYDSPLRTFRVGNTTKSENDLKKLRYEYNFWLGRKSAEFDLTHYTGRIDASFKNRIMHHIDLGHKKFAVSSEGGFAENSIETALHIYNANMDISVFGICLSGCAEDLIIGARNLDFYDEPIIGYHGNSLSLMHFLEILDLQDPCPAQTTSENFKNEIKAVAVAKSNLYKSTGHDQEFWIEQIKRLGEPKLTYVIDPENTCTRLQVFDRAEFWLPTSRQLKDLLKLEFKGSVCADSADCYERKLLIYFGPNRKFIVGDKAFITEHGIVDDNGTKKPR